MGWWNKLVRDKKQETVLDERFKDATPTSELVISANSTLDNKISNDNNLEKMTKKQLIEFAESEIGIELDKRLSKQKMIDRIADEK